MDDAALGMQMGAAKGGPITQRVSFAKGGAIPSRPTMNLAAGGASSAYPSYTPAAPAPTPGLQGNTLAATQYMNSLPGMTQVDTANPSKFYYTSYGPGSLNGQGGQQILANYGAMTPAQQQQYQQMIAGTWTPPAAAPAAVTPAAPTPAPVINPPSVQNITNYAGTPSDPSGVNTIDPTSTTTTGTPGVPNVITANSYNPNKIATTGTGSATDSTGGTNYSTDPNDQTKQILSAKGGAIPPLPTTRFAGAGAVSPNPVVAAMYAGTYNGPASGGNWVGSTPYSALAPNQQAWADQQKGVWSQINAGGAKDASYWGGGGQNPSGPVDTSQLASQLSLMPNAIWPTAAPTGPTPLNEPGPSAQNITTPQVDITGIDPTSTTTTGTPGVPTTGLQAKSYDPNNIATTGTGSATDSTGGTNYSTDPKDQTTQILSAKGGPITRRVNRYDDGGGVSPSIAGAPPGATGAQGAIPPIYYNPATYAAAGAPVGKGVSASSAPTYNAGAVPSLPMARGGAVGFDDGGMVAPGIGGDPELQQMAYEDAQDNAPAAPATPMTNKDPGFYMMPDQMASAAPAAPMSGGASSYNAPPPDPTTPQIKDEQGNPSRGLIGAISDGLHWLGDHLGLVGSAQAQPAIAHDPQTQDARQKLVTNHPDGATYITHQNVEELNDVADPNHQLQGAYRNIAGLEAGYKWALSRGDDATAGRLAASILHYSVLTSQNLSAEAAKSLYNGNMQDAVDKLNQASDAVPDGRLVHASLNPDGTVTIQGKNLNGQVEWQQHGAAATILERATSLGRSGKLQWDSLESQAAKYDSTFAEMAKNRQGNKIAQGKADQDAAAQSAANDAIGKLGPQFAAAPDNPEAAPAVTPRVSPALPGPGTTAATVGAPTSPDSTGTAQSASPPPSADSGYQPSALGGAPTQQGIPSTPTPPTQTGQADVPAPQAQDVDLTHNAAYQNIVAQTAPKYFTPQGQPVVGGQVMNRPPTIDEVTLRSYAPQVKAAYDERWKQYNQAVQQNQAAMRLDIDGQRRDITTDITSRRQADVTAHSDQAATDRMREQEKLQQTGAELAATRTKQAEVDKQHMAAIAPMSEGELGKRFGTQPDENGNAVGQSADKWLMAAPTWADAAKDKDFVSANSVSRLSDALVNTQRVNAHVSTNQVADFVAGAASDQYKYKIDPEPVKDDYGTRYHVVYTRPDGSQASLLVPEDDMNSIQRIQTAVRGKNQAPAPAIPQAASPTKNFPAPTAPVTMTPRGPVAAPAAPFIRPPLPPRAPSGGTGYGGPRRGYGLPPQPTP
jgi:hypothetical protein